MNLTCKLRNRRRRERAKEIPVKKRKRALRNRAVSTLEPEAAVLDQVLAGAGRGGIVVIPSLNPAFEVVEVLNSFPPNCVHGVGGAVEALEGSFP